QGGPCRGWPAFPRPSMPEEINRLCTDVLCDYLFTTDHFAHENLLAEGVPSEKIFFVGNVMIDTLMNHRELARGLDLMARWGLAVEQLCHTHAASPVECRSIGNARSDPRRSPGYRPRDPDRLSCPSAYQGHG